MARCWTCGAPTEKFSLTCSNCKRLKEYVGEKSLEEQHTEVIDVMRETHQQITGDFSQDMTKVKGEISNLGQAIYSVGFAIEGAIEELTWETKKQSEILSSIDKTLKMPSQTQANEWRQIADKSKKRGVLDDAEKYYLKAIEANPLDYRTYIGLAYTYLQKEIPKPYKAEKYLKKSIPHAPKDENFSYKSYSYKILGRLYASLEDYQKAYEILQKSLNITPDYIEAKYDYCLYATQSGQIDEALKNIKEIIKYEPLYWYFLREDRFLNPIKDSVNQICSKFYKDAEKKAESFIKEIKNVFKETKEVFANGKGVWNKTKEEFKDKEDIYNEFLKDYYEICNDKDYEALLIIPEECEKGIDMLKDTKKEIINDRKKILKSFERKQKQLKNINKELREKEKKYKSKYVLSYISLIIIIQTIMLIIVTGIISLILSGLLYAFINTNMQYLDTFSIIWILTTLLGYLMLAKEEADRRTKSIKNEIYKIKKNIEHEKEKLSELKILREEINNLEDIE